MKETLWQQKEMEKDGTKSRVTDDDLGQERET